MKTHHNKTKLISQVLCALVFVLLLSYGVLVNKTVLNVVARQDMQKEAASLRTIVGGLESSRMAIRTELTEKNAQSRGYVAVAHPVYIVAASNEVSINTASVR